MKLEPTISKVTPPTGATPKQANPTGDPVPSAEMTRQRQLHALINTWAKVEASQLLSPSKTQQALASLLNSTQPPAASPHKAASEPLQLAQIQLKTAAGLIHILSPRLYDKGSLLLISQDAQGRWQLQTSALTPRLSLTALSHQYRDLPLSSSSSLPLKAETPLPAPPSMLHSDLPLDVKLVKKALDLSGQFFERNLRQPPAATPTVPTAALTTQASRQPNTSKNSAPFDIKQGLIKVESQLQEWIKALPVSLNKTTSQPAQLSQAKPSQAKIADSLGPKASQPNQPNHFSHSSPQAANQDGKAWLIELQSQLFKAWQAQVAHSDGRPQINVPQPIQSGVNSAIQGEHQGALKHDKMKPEQLLAWLLAPKPPASPKALALWPENLSAQQQVHKLLHSMLLSVAEQPASPDDSGDKLLRQLQQVSQSLSRMQGEQINNRLVMQQQPDNLSLNFSLPYLHQHAMHWCELELSQESKSAAHKHQALGWHLVLRFAQGEEGAFAIESHLSGQQLQLTLWAQQREALANLQQHSPLLRHKLTAAGFQVENIQSKRGNPSKNSRQVHQSMIDVHT